MWEVRKDSVFYCFMGEGSRHSMSVPETELLLPHAERTTDDSTLTNLKSSKGHTLKERKLNVDCN